MMDFGLVGHTYHRRFNGDFIGDSFVSYCNGTLNWFVIRGISCIVLSMQNYFSLHLQLSSSSRDLRFENEEVLTS